MNVYYLMVWMEDQAQWWQVDEVEAPNRGYAASVLKASNPTVCAHNVTRVVDAGELTELLAPEPELALVA